MTDYKRPVQAARFRVKYRDYFHFGNFYEMLHEWMVEEGWATRIDSLFGETFYLHRENPKAGNEVWIWWRLNKNGATSFYKWELKLDIHVILLTDAEIIHEGQKFKANYGEPEISVEAFVVVDPKGEWDNHWFLKNFKDFYVNRLLKKEIESQRVQLFREMYRLQEAMKTYLKLQLYLPEPEMAKWYPRADFTDYDVQ